MLLLTVGSSRNTADEAPCPVCKIDRRSISNGTPRFGPRYSIFVAIYPPILCATLFN